MKLQVNYILQTMEKMAELKVNTIEPRFRKYISLMAFFEHPFQPMSPIRLVNKAVSIPGKIVQLTSKVRWVTGLKKGTSQLSAGYVKPSTHTPPRVSPYFLDTCPVHRSWYKNSQGINFILWPVNLLQYWWMTRVPDLLNDFKLTFDKAYFDL